MHSPIYTIFCFFFSFLSRNLSECQKEHIYKVGIERYPIDDISNGKVIKSRVTVYRSSVLRVHSVVNEVNEQMRHLKPITYHLRYGRKSILKPTHTRTQHHKGHVGIVERHRG
jgi:hypothetical protein